MNIKHKKVKLIVGTALLIVALFLFFLLAPVGFLVGSLLGLLRGHLGKYYQDIAISIDQGGNVILRDLLNSILIKSTVFQDLLFGHEDDTISCVLGRNGLKHNLAWAGKSLCSVLDLIDKDHCIKSAKIHAPGEKTGVKSIQPSYTEDLGPLSFLRKNIARLKQE